MNNTLAPSRRRLLALAGALPLASLVASCGPASKPGISMLYFSGLAEGARIRNNIPRFMQDTGIKVTYDELAYDSIRPRQLESFRQNVGDYDVIFVDDVWMYEYATKGYLEDLTSRVSSDKFDLSDFSTKVLAAESTLASKTWLIPQRADVQVLFYNKAIFADPGVQSAYLTNTHSALKVPQTWQEYAATARGLSGISFEGHPIVGCAETLKRPHFAFEFFATRYWSFSGDDFFDASFKPLFAQQSGIQALDFLASLKDVWAPGSLNAAHDETISALASGTVAMAPQWYAAYATLKKPSGGLGARLGVALMPGIDIGSGKIRRAPSIGGGSLGISANSAHKDEAWSFIKFITGRDIMAAGALAGEIITRKSAYADPRVRQNNPSVDVYLQSLELSKFRPRSTEYAAIETAIGEGVSRVLAGEATASAALADAVREVLRIQPQKA